LPMFLRRKPPAPYLLEELQQTYADATATSLQNLQLEDRGQLADALRGWKALHTLLLYKVDVFERKAPKTSPDEAAVLADLRAVRDENVRHLVRLQLRLDEQQRRGAPPAAPRAAAHKMSIPSLRPGNPQGRSFNGAAPRPMARSLRAGYHMSPQNRDTVQAAATVSWTRPKAPPGPDVFQDFDQTEMSLVRYERLNSVGSAGSAGSPSASPEPANLIDLDGAVHRSLEDLAPGRKRTPPPVPPKRGAMRAAAPAANGDSLARPASKPASRSTSDIPEPKKYVYKQPQPLNIPKMMQQSGARGRAKAPSSNTAKAPSSSTAKKPAAAASQPPKAPPADEARRTPAKKSNITYNYKPIAKARPAAAKAKPAPDRPRAPAAQTLPPTPTSPYMNNIISDYESDDEPFAAPEPAPPSGDMSAEEQAALIGSIRGIDEVSAHQILNDIVVRGDEVHWDDIVGLDAAKNSLKEAVVYPFLRPDLFRGLREPTRGMLLFGPPGTGKTMLARAVATESKSTFFSISSSSLTSKYLGESEKLVKALFLLAKKLSPSIVFIDEIDSLLGTRNDGEVESMRRIKNEFLVQWSELSSAAAGRDSTDGDVSRVLILGATNLPWGIDEAARRRFAKRVYIPLPEDETRKLQISKLLAYQNHTLLEEDFHTLIDLTKGFSGSDITLLAKDSAMGPLRSLGDKLLSTPTEEIRPIQLEDFVESLNYIRPSVSSEGLSEYENWSAKFGSSGA
ncbi:AAA-domain-containing protein, partial [Metschnikowia bicuspidata var. bicuspidata NRRL YB-4993]